MPNIAEIKKFVADAVKRELPSTKIAKVNMYEGESGIDGAPIFHIDLVFDDERLVAEEYVNLNVLVHQYFWQHYAECTPLFTFLTTEDALDYYDPPVESAAV